MGLEILDLSDKQRDDLRHLIHSPWQRLVRAISRKTSEQEVAKILTSEQLDLMFRFAQGEEGLAILINNLPMPGEIPPTPHDIAEYRHEPNESNSRIGINFDNVRAANLLIGATGKFTFSKYEGTPYNYANGLEKNGSFHADKDVGVLYCNRSLYGQSAFTRMVNMGNVFNALSQDDMIELAKKQFCFFADPRKDIAIIGAGGPVKIPSGISLAVPDIMTTNFIIARDGEGSRAHGALAKFADIFSANIIGVDLKPGQVLTFDNKQRVVEVPEVGKILHGWLHRGPDKWQKVPEYPGEHRWIAYSKATRESEINRAGR